MSWGWDFLIPQPKPPPKRETAVPNYPDPHRPYTKIDLGGLMENFCDVTPEEFFSEDVENAQRILAKYDGKEIIRKSDMPIYDLYNLLSVALEILSHFLAFRGDHIQAEVFSAIIQLLNIDPNDIANELKITSTWLPRGAW